MKKHIIMLILGVAMAAGIKAQNDIVYLKDGSFVKGAVLEYFANDHVRIKTDEGKVYSFEAAQLKRIKQGGQKGRKVFSLREQGYYNATSIGLLLRQDLFYGMVGTGNFEVVQGYQINPHWQTGLGVGLELRSTRVYFPLYADARYYFREKGFSPYLGLKAGYAFHADQDEGPWDSGLYLGGALAGMEVGIRGYTSERFGLTFGLEYRFQHDRARVWYGFWNDGEYIERRVTEITYMNQIGFRFGILFH